MPIEGIRLHSQSHFSLLSHDELHLFFYAKLSVIVAYSVITIYHASIGDIFLYFFGN